MRLVRNFVAASLCAGLAVSATPVLAGEGNPRINDNVVVEDDVSGDNQAIVELDGTEFSVTGAAIGVGTAGDDVEISFFTPLPSSASATDRKGNVRQSKFSEIAILIESEDPTRDLDFVASPEKCDVNGKVNLQAGTGNVTAKCSGDNIFSEITADQLTSIAAAFEGNNRVKVKVNSNGKASVNITIKGEAFLED